MKLAISALTLAAALSGCAVPSDQQATDAAPQSMVIHNPEIYATSQPQVDDDGIPLSVPAPATEPFPWASGTKGIAD